MTDDMEPTLVDEYMQESWEARAKRKPGRPKGLGKVPGSGRRKGTPNRTRVQVLDRINQQADPIGFLIRLARGLQFEAAADVGDTKKVKMYPTLDQQKDAVKILAAKVMPDLKATHLTGDLEPAFTEIRRVIITPDGREAVGNGAAKPDGHKGLSDRRANLTCPP